jgi:hypothetical protein
VKPQSLQRDLKLGKRLTNLTTLGQIGYTRAPTAAGHPRLNPSATGTDGRHTPSAIHDNVTRVTGLPFTDRLYATALRTPENSMRILDALTAS